MNYAKILKAPSDKEYWYRSYIGEYFPVVEILSDEVIVNYGTKRIGPNGGNMGGVRMEDCEIIESFFEELHSGVPPVIEVRRYESSDKTLFSTLREARKHNYKLALEAEIETRIEARVGKGYLNLPDIINYLMDNYSLIPKKCTSNENT